MKPDSLRAQRPQVYDFEKPAEFLSALLAFYKSTGNFSLRQRTAKIPACSQALVSQVINGRRELNRGNLPGIAAVFRLTSGEYHFLDGKLSSRASTFGADADGAASKKRGPRETKNHLLSDWLHPYVKDLVNLRTFELEPETLFSLLKGFAPAAKIKRSVEFLLREGFWRTDARGKIVAEDLAVLTTNEIPNAKIRAFHRKALEIAARGLTVFPTDRRKASTVLISVDQENLGELRGLIDSFQNQLLQFIEQYPDGKDALVQVAIHLTPIAEAPHETAKS
jgi:uncharacterized protein (TIGR02147 family)